jgi:hypothetical protein
MPIPCFTAGVSLPVPDVLLTGNNIITAESLANGRTFFPKGVSIGSSSNSEQQTNGYAMVRCILVGENDAYVTTRRINLGQSPIAVKKIWANGTTARGIEFLSE